MFRNFSISVIAAASIGLVACKSNPNEELARRFEVGSRFFLTTNLHIDPLHDRIRSQNFTQGKLLPVCSEIRVQSVDVDTLNFLVIGTGQRLNFARGEELLEPFGDHLSRYFGEKCDRAKIDALSELDQQGIKSGEVSVGMSKAGVHLALGFPPEHMNSSLESDRLVYAKNKWTLLAIHFDKQSLVTRIEE